MKAKVKQAGPAVEAAGKLVADRKAAADTLARLEAEADAAIKKLGGFTSKEMAQKAGKAKAKPKPEAEAEDDGLVIEDGVENANIPLDGRLMTDDQILAIHKKNQVLGIELARQKRESLVGGPNPADGKSGWQKLKDIANRDVKILG